MNNPTNSNFFKELEERYYLDLLINNLNNFYENNIEFTLPQIIPNYECYSTYYQSHFRGFLLALLKLKKVIIVSKKGNGDYTYKIISKI